MVVALYSAAQVREIDQAEIASGTPGIVLMRRAGKAALDELNKLWPDCDELLIVCGGGNNAGDGYVVAELALRQSLPVKVYAAKPLANLKGDALEAALQAGSSGVEIIPAADLLDHFSFSGRNPVIVDALLGTGFSGELSDSYAALTRWINASGKLVLALDLPSGVHADTGAVAVDAVAADATVSFVGRKKGLYTAAGKQLCGHLCFYDLLVSDKAYAQFESDCYLLEPQSHLGFLLRPIDSHKGRHGHAMIVAGRERTGGAGLLSAEACLRTGAGLTSLFAASTTVSAALSRLPEVMSSTIDRERVDTEKLARASALCLGPGLGLDDKAVELACVALTLDCPKILDADALTLMADGRISVDKESAFIMTPHPGEAARLLATNTANVQQNRFAAAEALNQRYGGVVVLKGAGTIVFDGSRTWVCDKGNPGMSVGGMGDVLSGVLVALLAQELSPGVAAQLGVWAHSYAADIEAEKHGPLGLAASDLIPTIRQILNGKAV